MDKEKRALLVVSEGVNDKINIGDYIQAVAAKQFIGDKYIFIERETQLRKYAGESVKIIMNGWFMDNPDEFPPSDKIIPLFVAFHINKLGLPGLVRKECIEYYKKYEPIGCRDTNTVKILKEKGVNAYFSGCLTLTLGLKYKSKEKDDKYYFVDPFFLKINLFKHPLLLIRTIYSLIRKWKIIKEINKKDGNNLLMSGLFYSIYSRAFTDNVMLKSEFINQYNYDIQKKYRNDDEKLKYAENLIQKYSKAKMVITSRIHCALPCLGLETPVVFITYNGIGDDRLSGLNEFFKNIILWDNFKLVLSKNFIKYGEDNIPDNGEKYKKYTNSLIDVCKKFFSK